MPKCLECGMFLPRLQWTHFKYKCNGSIRTINEYRKKYPDSKLVDDDIALKTSITLTNFIKKYGQEDGSIRWNNYRQKQAESNSYEYKKQKYSWTVDDYEKFNKSRAVTLKNLIKKHGDEDGTARWQNYCDRQAYTNTLDYFIEREGSIEKGIEIYKKLNIEKSKPFDPYYICKKYNICFDDAIELLSERRTQNFISDGERQFVEKLEQTLGYVIKYTYKTKQFCVWSHTCKQPFFYDIVCTDRKKCIEYNGDYWHANPKIYESSFVVKQSGLSATEIWEHDQLKINEITTKGFEVKIVWESDFINCENILIDIKKWMMK